MEQYENFKEWYADYCADEFQDDEDDSRLAVDRAYETGEELGLLYTTFDEEDEDGEYIRDEDGRVIEHDIQYSITLNPAEELIYVDNELVWRERYEDFDSLALTFQYCDFDSLYGYAMDYAREGLENLKKGE